MRKFKMTEKQEKSVTQAAQKLFACDAARLVNYAGPRMPYRLGSTKILKYFLIIGNYRNTRNDIGQWYKNGEPIHFRYLAEAVVACGRTMKELLDEMKQHHKLGGRAPSKGKQ